MDQFLRVIWAFAVFAFFMGGCNFIWLAVKILRSKKRKG